MVLLFIYIYNYNIIYIYYNYIYIWSYIYLHVADNASFSNEHYSENSAEEDIVLPSLPRALDTTQVSKAVKKDEMVG